MAYSSQTGTAEKHLPRAGLLQARKQRRACFAAPLEPTGEEIGGMGERDRRTLPDSAGAWTTGRSPEGRLGWAGHPRIPHRRPGGNPDARQSASAQGLDRMEHRTEQPDVRFMGDEDRRAGARNDAADG